MKIANRIRCFLLIGVLPIALGCASERENRLGQLNQRDPLLGEKIPNPNVPTGRDRYGSKEGRDPLLKAAAFDRDNSPLKMPEDRRATGSIAARDWTLGINANTDQLTSELQRFGAKVDPPTRTETGAYEVRVRVPSGPSGATSGYVGTGSSHLAALRDAYDQVKSDSQR